MITKEIPSIVHDKVAIEQIGCLQKFILMTNIRLIFYISLMRLNRDM
ncbi:MAG: hypothetical protein ACO3JF_03325 [Ilumatobacteraceae bacterium]